MSENHIKNVAIVGAGGQIGIYIVASLVEKNMFNITAVQRSGSTNTPAPGVHAVKTVDYSDHSSLVEALKGQDALIITMAVTAPTEAQQQLIRAAADANVPWVLPNEYGGDASNEQAAADSMIGLPKKVDRELIESLGKSSWIGIACSFWYEYSLSCPGFFGIDLRTKTAKFWDEGTRKINTSTCPQTGRLVAGVLSLPLKGEGVTLENYKNKFVYGSSFAVSQRDMLDSIHRVTGSTDSDWSISYTPVRQVFDEAKAKVLSGDRSGFPIMLYSRMFFPDNVGFFEGTHGLDNEKLGLPKEDLDVWTKKAVELVEEGAFEKMVAARSKNGEGFRNAEMEKAVKRQNA